MKNRGISLIVLVITVIVIIILSAIVIITLSNNNPINIANEAKFKQDILNFYDEFSLSYLNDYIERINADNQEIIGYELLKNYMPSITQQYAEILQIKDGEIVYIGKNEKEKKWMEDLDFKLYDREIMLQKEAKFKQDIFNFYKELYLYHSDNYIKLQTYNDTNQNAVGYNLIKNYIPNVTMEYADILQIKDGSLIYVGENKDEKKWMQDLNLKSYGSYNLFNVDEFVKLCKKYDTTAVLVNIEGKNCLKVLNSKLLSKDFYEVYNNWKENTQYYLRMTVKPYTILEQPNYNSLYLIFLDKNNKTLIREYAVATKNEWQNIIINNNENTTIGRMTFSYGSNAYYLIDLDSIKLYSNSLI